MPDHQRYELKGARGRYQVLATLQNEQNGLATLALSDGRTITVPSGAMRRLGSSDGDEQSVSRRRVPTGQDQYAALLRDLEEAASSWGSRRPAEIGSLASDPATAQRAEWLRLKLDAISQTELSAKHRVLVQRADRVCEALEERLREPNFEAAKHLRREYDEAYQSLARHRQESKLAKVIRLCIRRLRELEAADWLEFSERFTANPHIVAPSQKTPVEVAANGEFYLPLKVILEGALAPASNIRVVFDQARGIETVGQLPVIPTLSPDESKTVRIRLVDRRRQGASDDVRVRAHLSYSGPNNETLVSARQRFTLQLRKGVSFEEIPNPFRDYASGVPVDDPVMFFGRETLIREITEHLSVRPVGRCYGLYGQKRSGKSSLTGQVRSALTGPEVIVCSLSMGTIDRSEITTSFVVEVLDQLREQLAGRLGVSTFRNLLTRWPEQREITASPLASFRKALSATRALLRQEGQSEARVILIVDEFTYLYELLRRDHVSESDQHQLRDFMRQWKSWLEAKLFSALVVGQDTMPAFINAFSNEFSVMHTERLDYLSEAETMMLADNPIRKQGDTTRFVGFALSAIHQYTGGHPFFTQILCDRVVSVANEQRRSDITDLEIDTAVETLLTGPREIGRHRFDCLLSADNTGVLLSQTTLESDVPRTEEVALKVLRRIALIAGPQNKPVERDLLELSSLEQRVFDDLCSRNVLASRDGKYWIRVMLFSEYIRRGTR